MQHNFGYSPQGQYVQQGQYAQSQPYAQPQSLNAPIQQDCVKQNGNSPASAPSLDQLPSYSSASTTASAPPSTPFLPSYFNLSAIPEGQLLFNSPQLITEMSTAEYETTSSKTVSYSKTLEKDSQELWKFFLTHNGRPILLVNIVGDHPETRQVQEAYIDAQGISQTRWRTETYTVTDFRVTLDASNYINPSWSTLYALTRKGQYQSFKEVLEQYTQDPHTVKEITMEKLVDWDFDNLRNALHYLIRWSGYIGNLRINFDSSHDKVVVRSNSLWSKCSHNGFVQCLCVVTCLWVIFAPINYFFKSTVKDRLVMGFNCVAPSALFYQNNARLILGAVYSKSTLDTVAL